MGAITKNDVLEKIEKTRNKINTQKQKQTDNGFCNIKKHP